MKKRGLLAFLILGVFILSLNSVNARVLTADEQAIYMDYASTPYNCWSMKTVTSNTDTWPANCKTADLRKLLGSAPLDLKDAVASIPDETATEESTAESVAEPAVSTAKKPGIFSAITGCIFHPLRCVGLAKKTAPAAATETAAKTATAAPTTLQQQTSTLSTSKPLPKGTIEYWEVNFIMDQNYWNALNIKDVKPGELQVEMICSFKNDEEGTCKSLNTLDLLGKVKNCKVPVSFWMELDKKITRNHVTISACSEVDESSACGDVHLESCSTSRRFYTQVVASKIASKSVFLAIPAIILAAPLTVVELGVDALTPLSSHVDGIAEYTTSLVTEGVLSPTYNSIPTSANGGRLTLHVVRNMPEQKVLQLNPELAWEAVKIGNQTQFLAYLQKKGSSIS